MEKPSIVVIDDARTAAAMERDLRRRFEGDYQILAGVSPPEILQTLEQLHTERAQVALVMAGLWLPDTTGVAVLQRAHELHPQARRLLLTFYGDVRVQDPVVQALTLGQIDEHFGKPWGPPEEQLYPVVEDLLSAWWKSTSKSRLELVRVVGPRWSRRSHELRDILSRNRIPHGFYDAGSAKGRQLLDDIGQIGHAGTAVITYNNRVLLNPSNQELATTLGANVRPIGGHYDLVVVGAGPAGLGAAVYASSEGLRTLVMEREAVGGQAGTTSVIRNYLGFPRGVGGADLTGRALQQASQFGAEFVYARSAQKLRSEGPDRVLTLADGTDVATRAVVIATGVRYRRLGAAGLDRLVGAGVFYGAAVTEAPAMSGQHVYVVGGANSAGQAAVHLAKYAASVTLVVRSGTLAAGMSDYLVKEIATAKNVTVRLSTEVVGVHGAGQLEELSLRTLGQHVERVPAAALFILIGAEPHTDWAEAVERDERGFLLTGSDIPAGGSRAWPLERAPMLLETSMPGVFAAGDVRHGSIKRVASAVGEGAVTVQLIHSYLQDLSTG
jgi:thioredoxin reductase (NADPH)